jgi:hypothetical protein
VTRGRRWSLLGAISKGFGSGGPGTWPNGPFALPERALRPRKRDFSRQVLQRNERAMDAARGAIAPGPSGPANVTDIPVRAAHGGALTNDRCFRSR